MVIGCGRHGTGGCPHTRTRSHQILKCSFRRRTAECLSAGHMHEEDKIKVLPVPLNCASQIKFQQENAATLALEAQTQDFIISAAKEGSASTLLPFENDNVVWHAVVYENTVRSRLQRLHKIFLECIKNERKVHVVKTYINLHLRCRCDENSPNFSVCGFVF